MEAVVWRRDVDCTVEVENSVVMEVGTVLGSELEVDVAAAVEVVSKWVVMLVVVVRAGELVSRVELLGREEVGVAEVGLVPEEEDAVCGSTVVVAALISVTGMGT